MAVLAAVSEPVQIALIGAIVTGGILPTWLAWWNSRVTKRQVTVDGGSSMLDKINKIDSRVESMKDTLEGVDLKADTARDLAKVNAEKLTLLREGQLVRDHKLEVLSNTVHRHIDYMTEVHDRTGQEERREQ